MSQRALQAVQKAAIPTRKGALKKFVLHNWRLYVILLPTLIWFGVFMYAPIYGVIIAFKDFSPRLGVGGSHWAQPVFKYFIEFFSTSIATRTILNTVMLSVYTLIISFPIPILFALLLNQIKHNPLRKFIQTVSYAPYFISSVVIVSMMMVMFSVNGFVNTALESVGREAIMFMVRPEYFRGMYIGSEIWHQMGFNSIIYIAALSGISPEYYEAAVVDGASKWKQLIYIELPLLVPTIVIMLILSIGKIMTVGYEQVYLMQSSLNTSVSEVISTYVYKTGLLNAQYSFATAIGLFNSITNFILVISANYIAKRFSSVSLF
jgi:putative aldouronate transport system permease protein